MNTNSVLLAYATRFGSTQEVAESVAASLREAGLKVDLRLMREVESLDQYEAVVLGAAIYNTKWHADAHQFLSQHQAALQHTPRGDLHAGAVEQQRGCHAELAPPVG